MADKKKKSNKTCGGSCKCSGTKKVVNSGKCSGNKNKCFSCGCGGKVSSTDKD